MSRRDSEKLKRMLKIGGVIVGLLIVVAVTVLGALWVVSLRDEAKLLGFQQRIDELGLGGWFILLAIQYIQIVIAFIPGGPIQVVAGALYGPVKGMLTCLMGTVLATMTVFWLVQKYGHRVLRLFVEEGDIRKYKFLHNAKRLEMLVLVLFFIPGTPKDALTYLFALTPLKLPRFMVLSTLARIPAMLTSVLAGDSIIHGQWLRALIMFVAISVISLGGLLLHGKVIAPRMHREDGEG